MEREILILNLNELVIDQNAISKISYSERLPMSDVEAKSFFIQLYSKISQKYSIKISDLLKKYQISMELGVFLKYYSVKLYYSKNCQYCCGPVNHFSYAPLRSSGLANNTCTQCGHSDYVGQSCACDNCQKIDKDLEEAVQKLEEIISRYPSTLAKIKGNSISSIDSSTLTKTVSVEPKLGKFHRIELSITRK